MIARYTDSILKATLTGFMTYPFQEALISRIMTGSRKKKRWRQRISTPYLPTVFFSSIKTALAS
jgi:hypothetical protein